MSGFEIRRYRATDAQRVGALIADVYGSFNLGDMTPTKRMSMLGPFAAAGSANTEHRQAIADAIAAPSVWVAVDDGEIVGVVRGGRTDSRGRTVLSSLFVSGRHHRRGIGRALVEQFEAEYAAQGAKAFKVSSTEYAVAFYAGVGYKRTTGVRSARSFGEPGLAYQPMKKTPE